MPHGTAPWDRPAHPDGRIKVVTQADKNRARRAEKNRGTAAKRITPIQPVRLHKRFIFYEKKGRIESLQGAVLQYAQQLDGASIAAALRALAIRNSWLTPNHRRRYGMPERVLDTLMYATDVRLREKNFRPKFLAMLLDDTAKLEINLAEHSPNGVPLVDLLREEIEERAPYFDVLWASTVMWGCLRHNIILSDEALRAFLNTYVESRLKGISHFYMISGLQNMIKMVELRGGALEEMPGLAPDLLGPVLCETITFRKGLKKDHIVVLMDLFEVYGLHFDKAAVNHFEERFNILELPEEDPLWERLEEVRSSLPTA